MNISNETMRNKLNKSINNIHKKRFKILLSILTLYLSIEYVFEFLAVLYGLSGLVRAALFSCSTLFFLYLLYLNKDKLNNLKRAENDVKLLIDKSKNRLSREDSIIDPYTNEHLNNSLNIILDSYNII